MTLLALALPLSFEEPQWLWLLLLVPVMVVASLRSLAGLDPVRRWLALTSRSLLIVVAVMCLAGIEYVRQNDDLTVIALMDRSHSAQHLLEYQEQFLREASEGIPAEDRLGVIDFARNAFLEQLPMKGGYHIRPGKLPQMQATDRTDIASALRLAMAMFPYDSAKRIVLLSDGNDNMGDVLSEAARAGADGIPIDIVPLWYRHRNEVFVERLIAPTYAEEGEMVPLRMVLSTDKPVAGTLSIFQNGQAVALPEEARRITLNAGSNTLRTKLPVNTMGAQRFEVEFRPDDDSMDAIPFNNRGSAFSFVSGSRRVLVVTSDPRQDAILAEALRSEHVDVDLKTPSELGSFDLADMMSYSTIVLANVAANLFTDEQQIALGQYVRDMGSGLIMTGGDEAFGAGGWIGTPVEEVMPVSFEIKHKRVIPRGALVIICHSCEMPRGNWWGKEMAKKSVDTVSSQDYLGVIAYSFAPAGVSWEVPLDLCTNKGAVKAKIDRMQIGDMPDFDSAMRIAYSSLTGGRGKDAAQKHMIIISDGDPQPPSKKLLNDYAAAGITVSTIAIGWGAHVMTQTLNQISTVTGGRFYPAQNPKQLPQIFVKESKVVRRPLIVNEAFSPSIYHASTEMLPDLAEGEAIPPLGGLVLTSPKPNPNVQMPLVRATDDGNDPVLAHWQCELGKAVAFTSGYWPVWGDQWTQWQKFAKFWAQIVRWSMRQDTPANFDTYTRVEGNKARIVVDAVDEHGNYLNHLRLPARVVGPDGVQKSVTLTQTGPGHYETEFDAEKAGQYLANIQIESGGRPIGTIRTGASVSYSPEYKALETNEALLRQIQEVSGGRWLDVGDPKEANLFSHDLPPSVSRKAAWEWVLAWIVLPLFLLDVAVRRLASWLAFSIAVEVVVLVVMLFGVGTADGGLLAILGTILLAEVIGWTIRFRYIRPMFEFLTHPVTALAGAGDRSSASLGQLKHARERVREEATTRLPPDARRVAADDGEQSRRQSKVKFDIGPQAANEQAGDLADALGGAKAGDTYKEKRRAAPDTEGSPGKDEATTSRLLRARRKARQDQDDE